MSEKMASAAAGGERQTFFPLPWTLQSCNADLGSNTMSAAKRLWAKRKNWLSYKYCEQITLSTFVSRKCCWHKKGLIPFNSDIGTQVGFGMKPTHAPIPACVYVPMAKLPSLLSAMLSSSVDSAGGLWIDSLACVVSSVTPFLHDWSRMFVNFAKKSRTSFASNHNATLILCKCTSLNPEHF
jgi:hypothetical protein